MASCRTQSTKKPPAPRRTSTIGVRLTPDEIAALDRCIADQTEPVSRAGAIAGIVVEVLEKMATCRRSTMRDISLQAHLA